MVNNRALKLNMSVTSQRNTNVLSLKIISNLNLFLSCILILILVRACGVIGTKWVQKSYRKAHLVTGGYI